MEFEFIPDVFGSKSPEQIEDYLNSVPFDSDLVEAITEWVDSLPDQVDEINSVPDPQHINDGLFGIVEKAQVIMKAMCEAFFMLCENAIEAPQSTEDC